ncbi:MAG: hypothetical protein RIS47_1349 [Bacteroidota bacterium]|jgi:GTP-binding protein
MMIIHSSEFLISNTDPKLCPPDNKPEYAFIGRSNVGKSSLINMLTEQKKLAKVSGQPGKTQTINHFLINKEWYLVDLPGYGYAKTSKKLRESFTGFIREYIVTRKNLIAIFVLLDSRLPPQRIDMDFMESLGNAGIPFVMVFTKIDKMSSSGLNKNILEYKRKMLDSWSDLPHSFLSSATSSFGRDEILTYIDDLNKQMIGKL